MPRVLLVEGKKTFRITIPDEAKITFGPWSPGSKNDAYSEAKGTLRVYETKNANANILGVWSGVTGFREEEIEYEEMVIREEGRAIWNSSKKGYRREEEVNREIEWDNPNAPKQVGAGSDEEDLKGF